MKNESNKQDVTENAEITKTPRLIKINTRTALIIVGIVVLAALAFYLKGLAIAASVDGSFISRASVIKELEKQSGKNVLDSLVTEKLIENESRAKGITVSQEELNQEIKNIEAQVISQGGTLQDALAQTGMTEEALRKQVKVQKQIEKILADKVVVTDEEVQKYITDNKVTLPKGQETQTKDQIKSMLKDQKLNQEAGVLITNLKNNAKIKYYVNY